MRTLLADGAFGHQEHLSGEAIARMVGITECEAVLQQNDDDVRASAALRTDDHVEQYKQLETLRDNALIVQQKLLSLIESGHIGLAHKAVAVGDCVYVLCRSRTSCFLQAVQPKGTFRLVGQCYVEGVMYGEAFREDCAAELVIA